MPDRAKPAAIIALAALFLVTATAVTIYALDTVPATSHPAIPASAVPIVPAHTHATDIPSWAIPAILAVVGMIQLLVGIAIKATLKQYVLKEECAMMHKETYQADIKPLADGAAERREKMKYLEQMLRDLATHTDSNIVEINHRLKMIEHNLQRLTFHLLGETGFDIKGGD